MRRIDRVGKTLTKAIAVALSFSIMFGQTIGSYADELNTIDNIIAVAEEDVEAAEDIAVDIEAIVIADTAEVEAALNSFDVSANVVDTKSDDAIADANVANTTSDKTEAYAAKENAEANLATAETALEDSNKVFENAQNNYNDVSANYATADSAYNTAVAALEDVSANTVAAEKALEEAKALIEVESSNKEKLENMEDQYYGLYVQYYRSILKDNTIFEDGKLDISANAEQLTEQQINDFAKNGDTNFFKYGRFLSKELVEYMIINRDDVSYNNEENEFTFGTTGTGQIQEGAEAVIVADGNGNDKAILGEKENYIWNRTNYNGGRGNSVEVTYKDKEGNLHTEHYNYVLKSSAYNDDIEVENGMIYLALVEKHDDNRFYPVAVSDNNNYSDYSKLTAAVEAYRVLNDYIDRYNQADAAVKALKARYDELSVSANATKAELDSLKAALIDASEALASAEAKKEEVTAKYEEAKKAVEGIDLSRFAVVPVAVVSPAAETPAEEPAAEPEVIVVPAAAPIAIAPILAAPEGEEVEEVEEVAAEVTIDEEDTPLTAGPEAEPEEEKEVVEPVKVAGVITANIEGDEVPLTALPLMESLKTVWWIWIIIAITTITMYIIYKKNSKEEETH